MEKEIVDIEIDIRGYAKGVWKNKQLILVAVLVSLITSGSYSFFVMQKNEYQTNGVIYFKSPPGDLSDADRYSSQVIAASITSNDILGKTVEQSGLAGIEPFRSSKNPKEDAIGWLKENLQITPKAQLIVPLSDKEIDLTLKGDLDPQLLQEILTTHIDVLKEEITKQLTREAEIDIKNLNSSIASLEKRQTSILKEIEGIPQVNKSDTSDRAVMLQNFITLTTRLTTIEDKLNALEISRNNLKAVADPDFNFVDVVRVPSEAVPVPTNAMRNVAMAGILGLVAGVFAAFFKSYMEGPSLK